LHDRRPPVHVVRRERRRQEPAHELAHLLDLEPLACLDRCPTGEAGREAIESVGPAAEAAVREIRYQLLEAARRVKPRLRGGSGVRGRESGVRGCLGSRSPGAPAGAAAPTSAHEPPIPGPWPPTLSGAAAASGPSARRTASSTTCSTKNFSRNRTSSFVG